MTQRKLTLLGAAVLGAMLSLSAGAEDRNMSGMPDSGDRGVTTPGNVTDSPMNNPGYSGASRIPSINQPSSVPDNMPSDTGRQYQSARMRDSRLLPSPITPSSVNEANQQTAVYDRNNDGGMGRDRGWDYRYGYGPRDYRYGTGGTR